MPRPLVLFGAFDRHNFGDLLLGRVGAALLPRRDLLYAGLAARDLRADGGHAVRALPEVLASVNGQAVDLLHVGGETLTCTAWEAAVMLQPPDAVQHTLAYLERRPSERTAWVRQVLGRDAQAPYVVGRDELPPGSRLWHLGVGGVALARRDAALRAEVGAKLRTADGVTVRDAQTLTQLRAAGVNAGLLPDPAVMARELFAAQWERQAQQGEVAQLRRAFPQGFLAVQCSAEFGDDATLAPLAAQLDAVQAATGLGLVLFRAGAAPWHDDLLTLQRLAERLHARQRHVFASLHLWDICALIAHSRGYAGSSLHGRIVALACGLPRVNLCPPRGDAAKQAAFAERWDGAVGPAVLPVAALAEGLLGALTLAPATLLAAAGRTRAAFREGCAALLPADARGPARRP